MYTLSVHQFTPTDPRLGRHVRHDSRSLAYRFPVGDVRSAKHESNLPTFDQGDIGSCTGNASTKCLSYMPFWNEVTAAVLGGMSATEAEMYAVSVYSDATVIDSFPGEYKPDDTGSDGLSVAKVLQSRGLISGYQHATSLDAALSALSQQPVIVGTVWAEDMFSPDAEGRIQIGGNEAGGHEYVLDQIDVENERVWIQNSWGNGWGISGRAWITFSDMGQLLANDGDCTVFTPATAPAPQPTDPTEVFKAAAESWLVKKHATKYNSDFAAVLKTYLASI